MWWFVDEVKEGRYWGCCGVDNREISIQKEISRRNAVCARKVVFDTT